LAFVLFHVGNVAANYKNRNFVMDLKTLGWNDFFEDAFRSYRESGFSAGRVAIEHKSRYVVYAQPGELSAEVTGKLLYVANSAADLPKVGDWVVISIFDGDDGAIIHEVLPRRTKFSRQAAGKRSGEQVLAANIDVIFIVQGLDHNFNLRRLERYLVMVYESKAQPVIILNKADLCEDVEMKVNAVKSIAGAAEIFAVSAETGAGVEALQNFLGEGKTAAFVGSSGVGKSTLINRLSGREIQKTAAVRESDSRGRHTTSRRELFLLPQGGLLIDTPGMRELQLWSAGEGFGETFADIETLAEQCHFADCTHTQEIKCAVQAALENGSLAQERYQSYRKLQKELAYLELQQDKNGLLEKKRRDKQLHKMIKQIYKRKT
jgi:ribosome biogenesis GTPase